VSPRWIRCRKHCSLTLTVREEEFIERLHVWLLPAPAALVS
jgi:hypothetical protein